jgi:hypothetical protein
MLSVGLRSGSDREPRRSDLQPGPCDDQTGNFIAGLCSGGDSRIVADPRTGLNKYLCPNSPAPELTSVSSCTATPISPQGFARATATWREVIETQSPRLRARRLHVLTESIETRLLQYFGVGALAHAILCPYGTDAMLTTAMLIAAERPNEAMTAILPAASETGTGVPMAASCRMFDGPDTGRSLSACVTTTVEVSLRSADGSPRSDDQVNDAFASATATAPGRPIVYLTQGTKTGLIAPLSAPRGADVIVDACQGRIAPQSVAAYLNLGWPVVVTGSKFFGGPAFSGAVLFPRARLPTIDESTIPLASSDSARLGTALRWTAALDTVDAFEPRAIEMAAVLSACVTMVERSVASNSALVPIAGLPPAGCSWADQPSIFTFAVRDPNDLTRLLSAAELRPLYERLAREGVLFGQPVSLGSFGGLRVAIGARNLLDGFGDGVLADIFAVLARATAGTRIARKRSAQQFAKSERKRQETPT